MLARGVGNPQTIQWRHVRPVLCLEGFQIHNDCPGEPECD
jgi:hypothetical protein